MTARRKVFEAPIRVLTYNIRHGRGLDGRVSLSRIASVIEASGADLVALQEVDAFSCRSGFRRQAVVLARNLGLRPVFGPTKRTLLLPRFGNAVLSRFPVAGVRRYRLPGRGEPRGLLAVTAGCGAGQIVFLVTHLGLTAEDRRLQVQRIAEILQEMTGPFVLCGDFNCQANAPEMTPLYPLVRDAGALCDRVAPTYPAQRPEVRIDYVFVSPHWSVENVEVLKSDASDHLPVVANLAIAAILQEEK